MDNRVDNRGKSAEFSTSCPHVIHIDFAKLRRDVNFEVHFFQKGKFYMMGFFSILERIRTCVLFDAQRRCQRLLFSRLARNVCSAPLHPMCTPSGPCRTSPERLPARQGKCGAFVRCGKVGAPVCFACLSGKRLT